MFLACLAELSVNAGFGEIVLRSISEMRDRSHHGLAFVTFVYGQVQALPCPLSEPCVMGSGFQWRESIHLHQDKKLYKIIVLCQGAAWR